MSANGPDSSSSQTNKNSNKEWLLRVLWRAWRYPQAELTAERSASTLVRFLRSKHVFDLRLICFSAAIVFLITFIVGVYPFVLFVWEPFKADHSNSLTEYVSPLVTLCGGIETICVAAMGWAYLSAAKRLGVVDLFACEIGTLCRVGTVFDVGKLYTNMYDHDVSEETAHSGSYDSTANSAKFDSEEEYFPIFNNNSQDLQALEALVVIKITEFYTYMKAARDSRRALATIKPPRRSTAHPQSAQAKSETDPWHENVRNLIYVLFLAYESGRKAIKDLIEFEPTAAETTMVILLTELICYSFLCEKYQGDELRFPRLKLREEIGYEHDERGYKIDVPELYRKVMESHGRNEKYWMPAKRTAPELRRRYNNVFKDSPIP